MLHFQCPCVRCGALVSSALMCCLSLQFLSTPLTPEEIAMNKLTRLTLDPEVLPTFSFEFTPAVHGALP